MKYLVMLITLFVFSMFGWAGENNPIVSEVLSINLDSFDNEVALIRGIDADKQGNIYLLDVQLCQIVTLDPKGKFLKAFGRKGSGPGEFKAPVNLRVMSSQEIVITDLLNRKFSVYKNDGTFVKDIRFKFRISGGFMLDDGSFLIKQSKFPDAKDKRMMTTLNLYSSSLEKNKELVALESINMFADKIIGRNYNMSFSCSGGGIAVGNPANGYEVLLFDLNGKPLKPIKRKFVPVPVSEHYKKKYIENWGKNYQFIKDKLEFPETLPPFHYISLDDKGRIFVFTYQESQSPSGYQVDIFSPGGEYIGPATFKYPPYAGQVKAIKGNRFYYVYEDESGVQHIVVFGIRFPAPR